MMLLILGLVLTALGALCGVALLAAGLGAAGVTAGLALWVLFPLLCLFGFGLFVMDASLARIRGLSLALSGLLLTMAVVALAVVLLQAGGLFRASADPAALWYVMVVAGVLGLGGATAGRLQRPAAV